VRASEYADPAARPTTPRITSTASQATSTQARRWKHQRARATLYRHFPTRERLLQALTTAARFGTSDYTGDAEQQIGTMIKSLLRRGIDDGTLRADLTVDELASMLGSLLQAAARMTADHQAGVEKAAALATTVFLHGTRNPAGPDPAQGHDQELDAHKSSK
jgi:hypothetical protein